MVVPLRPVTTPPLCATACSIAPRAASSARRPSAKPRLEFCAARIAIAATAANTLSSPARNSTRTSIEPRLPGLSRVIATSTSARLNGILVGGLLLIPARTTQLEIGHVARRIKAFHAEILRQRDQGGNWKDGIALLAENFDCYGRRQFALFDPGRRGLAILVAIAEPHPHPTFHQYYRIAQFQLRIRDRTAVANKRNFFAILEGRNRN